MRITGRKAIPGDPDAVEVIPIFALLAANSVRHRWHEASPMQLSSGVTLESGRAAVATLPNSASERVLRALADGAISGWTTLAYRIAAHRPWYRDAMREVTFRERELLR